MSVQLSISLSPTPGSFAFHPKRIPLLSKGRVPLGMASPSAPHTTPRYENGWFSPIPVDADDDEFAMASPATGPLSVSECHAELFVENNQVFIRDLDSAFGTFVNDIRVSRATAHRIQRGDVIRLGVPVPRNRSTPPYITDDQLKPIIATVTFT